MTPEVPQVSRPRNEAAERFMEAVSQAVLDPAIAKMFGVDGGEVLLALVSPDSIRDAMREAVAEERRRVIAEIRERLWATNFPSPIERAADIDPALDAVEADRP